LRVLNVVRGALVLVLLFASANTTHAISGQGGTKEEKAHAQKGEDAPLYSVVETFLLEASGWNKFPEDYPAFCSRFSIDASWPSAQPLGTEGDRILREYHERVRGHDPQGARWVQDPDEWKLEELGRVFGQIFEQLRNDGLRLPLRVFLRVVEIEVRPTFSTFSDQPFDETEETRKDVLFWKAMAITSDEAAEIVERGRV
jgi:hypothetical protein